MIALSFFFFFFKYTRHLLFLLQPYKYLIFMAIRIIYNEVIMVKGREGEKNPKQTECVHGALFPRAVGDCK